MGLTIQHLDWDSKFFGFKVAKIFISKFNVNELLDSFEKLQKDNYKMVALHSNEQIENLSLVFKRNYKEFHDLKLTFSKSINKKIHNKLKNKFTSAFYEINTPCDELFSLAIQSSRYSRFRRDPNFHENFCDDMYKKWISSSLIEENNSKVIIVKMDSKLVGMISFSEKFKNGYIDLIATDNNYMGQGIASHLIYSAEKFFLSRNINKINVVTQGINIPACKLYESSGYKIEKKEYIAHCWL